MTTAALLTAREQHRAEALTHAAQAALTPPELVFGEIRHGERGTYRPRCQPVRRTAPPVVRVWPVVVDISPLHGPQRLALPRRD